jgi:hypothetical protein
VEIFIFFTHDNAFSSFHCQFPEGAGGNHEEHYKEESGDAGGYGEAGEASEGDDQPQHIPPEISTEVSCRLFVRFFSSCYLLFLGIYGPWSIIT